jgi:hypothetical protein
MVLDKEENRTTVFQEGVAFGTFMENFRSSYPKIKNDNLILNLCAFHSLTEGNVLDFQEISTAHRARGKSFVLVSDVINYDSVPDEICLVPTLQEARDIIDMEEIERDLGL